VGLEGWNVEDSPIVNEWCAKFAARGYATGRLEEVRNLILRLGGKRFGPAPAGFEAAIRLISDLDRLERIADRIVDGASWDDLVATMWKQWDVFKGIAAPPAS
jgi:hypothetical protein